MHIKNNINYLINKNNISYSEIERKSGVSKSDISKLIREKRDQRNLTIETVVKLATYFNVSLDDFVFKDLSLNDTQE
jgi:Plasmid maintenance system antidote protein